MKTNQDTKQRKIPVFTQDSQLTVRQFSCLSVPGGTGVLISIQLGCAEVDTDPEQYEASGLKTQPAPPLEESLTHPGHDLPWGTLHLCDSKP